MGKQSTKKHAKRAPKPPSRADEERAFLDGYDPSAYERPSVTVDVALLTACEGDLFTLLVRRSEPPDKGRWSLPGGFVGMTEPLDAAAFRVLNDKAGTGRVFLEQLYTFGDPDRDPRTRVITVAYYALIARERFPHDAGEGRTLARVVVPWEGETGGPVQAQVGSEVVDLAFDHADILGMAVKRIRGKLDYTPIGFQLLPETFTLRQLQDVHETVLARPVNKDSFRRRMLASGLLEATGERQRDVEHRPAELYRFAKRSAV